VRLAKGKRIAKCGIGGRLRGRKQKPYKHRTGRVRYFWPALSYGRKGKFHVEL